MDAAMMSSIQRADDELIEAHRAPAHQYFVTMDLLVTTA
jgi:hypothetical protein